MIASSDRVDSLTALTKFRGTLNSDNTRVEFC